MRIVTSFATAALIAATTTSLASAATFTFAGYTFDDTAEPTSAAGSGNVSTFGITPSFNGGSLGTYFGNTSPSAVALGEPSKGGTMGVLNLTYSTPVTLGAGTDFVVFESGNKDGAGFGAGSGFEPFRVTLLTDLGFSSTYTPLFADGFVNNSGVYVTSSSVTSPTTNGLFVYEIDVQALVPGATSVSAIIFQTPTVTGTPGYDPSKRDPDIAYVGRRVAGSPLVGAVPVPSPAAAGGGLIGITGLVLRRRRTR